MNDKYYEDYYSRTDMRGAIVEYHPQNFPEGVQSNGAIAFLDRDGVLNIGRQAMLIMPNKWLNCKTLER